MKIKSFYAETMEQALQAASRELGDEALILNTREAPLEFRHCGRYEVVCACANAPITDTALTPPAAESSTLHQPMVPTAARRVIVAVGPAGAGKSLSCAKIAIRAKFGRSLSPALLSWDCGRLGGSDLLRAYADIAGIPMLEIDSLEASAEAFRALAAHDLLIIDTPAIDGNEACVAEIVTAHRSAVGAGCSLETHLVVSGAFSSNYLAKCFQTYSVFEPSFLLPTHLDESALDLTSAGLEQLAALRIEWCGTGRAVPEDMQESSLLLASAAALPLAPTAPAATAIEQLLTRLRREEIPQTTHLIRASAQNAA